jgi:hypothetical protein
MSKWYQRPPAPAQLHPALEAYFRNVDAASPYEDHKAA